MSKRRSTPAAQAGDLILFGKPGVSMPEDWVLARVLWAGGGDVVTEHETTTGDIQRQVLPAEYVRAVGSVEELGAFRRRCEAAVGKQRSAVLAAERKLADAHTRVWLLLDAIAEGTAP